MTRSNVGNRRCRIYEEHRHRCGCGCECRCVCIDAMCMCVPFKHLNHASFMLAVGNIWRHWAHNIMVTYTLSSMSIIVHAIYWDVFLQLSYLFWDQLAKILCFILSLVWRYTAFNNRLGLGYKFIYDLLCCCECDCVTINVQNVVLSSFTATERYHRGN